MKKYLNISEASKIIGLKEHVIRYWDSIDPKTNKVRVEGISTKTKGGTRYFNKENISKLINLKKIIYENGEHNNLIKLADKVLNTKKITRNTLPPSKISIKNLDKKDQKLLQILKQMRFLLR